MIFESFTEGVEDDIACITRKVMLMLAIATSIDAMAAFCFDFTRYQPVYRLYGHRCNYFSV